ncbi:MAG: hypothetical protein U9Q81_01780 [Pseudomonadota bacterium]|nr:hypothetical protein [Pseudomonadota bacterium]
MIERLLYRISARRPCRFIDGEQGEPYLERYYLFGALGWHAYLHRFVDSDPDRGLHDHPWNRALSLVLSGGYEELRPSDRHARCSKPHSAQVSRDGEGPGTASLSPHPGPLSRGEAYGERQRHADRIESRFIRPFRINFLCGEDFHRVVLQGRRPAWTLFIHGPRAKGWGFLQNGTFRTMAKDENEFRHRDWWKNAPKGHEMRALREVRQHL